MFNVRCERIESLISDDVALQMAWQSLPAWRLHRAEAFRFQADRRRSVAVWLLLRQLLIARGIAADALSVRENEYGRPMFPELPEVHFNLSHAGDRVMAVVADSAVGCDVEQLTSVDDQVAERCLSTNELLALKAIAKGPARDRYFCRLWVRKESYAKALGIGMSLDFRTFSVLPGREPRGYHFEDFSFDDGYLACVCCEQSR